MRISIWSALIMTRTIREERKTTDKTQTDHRFVSSSRSWATSAMAFSFSSRSCLIAATRSLILLCALARASWVSGPYNRKNVNSAQRKWCNRQEEYAALLQLGLQGALLTTHAGHERFHRIVFRHSLQDSIQWLNMQPIRTIDGILKMLTVSLAARIFLRSSRSFCVLSSSFLSVVTSAPPAFAIQKLALTKRIRKISKSGPVFCLERTAVRPSASVFCFCERASAAFNLEDA